MWGEGIGVWTSRKQTSLVEGSMKRARYRGEVKQPRGVGRKPRRRQVKEKGRDTLALGMRHEPGLEDITPTGGESTPSDLPRAVIRTRDGRRRL